MGNKNYHLEDYDIISMIANDISQSKYSITNDKILAMVNAGYFKKEELATPEAFYAEFKSFGRQELGEILQANEIIAKDGVFTTKEGLQASYDKVLGRVLETANIEQFVDRFLSSNFGEEYANKYISNLAAQKEFATEIYTAFFDNNNITPSHDLIKDIPVFNIYDSVASSLPKHTVMATGYEANQQFGVPSFEITRGDVKAEFSSGVEVRHMINNPEVLEAIKYVINNPKVVEDLQEDVWLRNPLNKKPNLVQVVNTPELTHDKPAPKEKHTLKTKIRI